MPTPTVRTARVTRVLVHIALVATLALLLVTNPVVADAARKVTGKQIKNGSVTGRDLRDHSVKSVDLADGSVTGSTVADQTLTGADIVTGSLPVVHRVVLRQNNGPVTPSVQPGGTLTTSASCLPGETIIGGGAISSNARMAITQSWPSTSDNRWIAVISNLTADPVPAQVVAYASCAS